MVGQQTAYAKGGQVLYLMHLYRAVSWNQIVRANVECRMHADAIGGKIFVAC